MPLVPSATAARILGELTQVLHAFFHALDERRYDRVLDLFTEDGRWFRQGQWFERRSAIGAALDARPLDAETRHVLTNSHLRELDGASAVIESYMTAYRYPASSGPDRALAQVCGPLRFNLTTTVFRLDTGHDWRIAEQRLVPAFGFAD